MDLVMRLLLILAANSSVMAMALARHSGQASQQIKFHHSVFFGFEINIIGVLNLT